MIELYSTVSCPYYSRDNLQSVRRLKLQSWDLGTIIEFEGYLQDANYNMQVVKNFDKKCVYLWQQKKTGCFLIPIIEWNNEELNQKFEIGSNFRVPIFRYVENILQNCDGQFHCDVFRNISIIRKDHPKI